MQVAHDDARVEHEHAARFAAAVVTAVLGLLAPLGREGEEGALRSRYVATLGNLEDRLAAFGEEEQRANAEIARLEGEAQRRLAELSSKEQ